MTKERAAQKEESANNWIRLGQGEATKPGARDGQWKRALIWCKQENCVARSNVEIETGYERRMGEDARQRGLRGDSPK